MTDVVSPPASPATGAGEREPGPAAKPPAQPAPWTALARRVRHLPTRLRDAVRREAPVREPRPVRPARPGWAAAMLTGAGAALLGLAACVALVLAGQAASGSSGGGAPTPDTLRGGLLVWLLGHGSGVRTTAADIAAIPLGLSVLLAALAAVVARHTRVGSRRRAGLPVGTVLQVVGRVAGFATVYAGVLAAGAGGGVLAGVHVHPLRAIAGGWVLAAVGGALGLVGPRTAADRAYRGMAFAVIAVLRGAVAGCCVVLAGAVGVFSWSLLRSASDFADLVSALHPSTAGAAVLLVALVLTMPNVLGLTASVLVGPGFALGTGTTVTATSVTLGALPQWPPVALLPPNGSAPGWAVGLLVVPVLGGVAAGWLAASCTPRGPLRRLAAAVCAGLLAGLLVGSWALLSGGAVGPGRMSDIGAAAVCLPVAVATLGAGSLLGGCARLLAGGRAEG